MAKDLTKKSAMIRKIMLGAAGIGLGAALGAYAMMDYAGSRAYAAQAVNEARSVADMAENFGTWASKYKGIWIKNDQLASQGADPGSFIDTQRYQKMLEADGAQHAHFDTYHRKNPALVQRELADISQQSNARGKFRLTSEKYMNPMNAPDGFDLKAIRALEQSTKREYFEFRSGELRYARRVEAKESCLSCHGTPEVAPKAIAMMYPGPQGYGYVKGGLAGIISVRLPYDYDRKVVLEALN